MAQEIISSDYDIKILDIDLLKPFPNNPRQTNQDAIDGVKQSIKDNHFSSVIVVDKDFQIIAGHTRHAAAKQLGIKNVPVFVAKNLDETAARRLRILDNRLTEIAPWDAEKLASEMNNLDVDDDFRCLFDDMSAADFATFDEPEPTDKDLKETAAVIQHILIFETELQRARWHEFLHSLSERYPNHETHAARLDQYIIENER
tara:strand:- start:998 stop:1603 length:606 start_codon:yes stop_codon:yes gene_type:complete